MKFNLLRIGKWLSLTTLLMLVVYLILFTFDGEEKSFTFVSDSTDKVINITTTLVEHETITEYNPDVPSTVSRTKTEGKDGLIFKDKDGNIISIEEPQTEVIEVGTGKTGVYNGIMTAYGPDCYGCSATGTVACRTREKTSHSLISDGITYNDTEYGEVRILAAALSEFPCGTIIEVESRTLGNFTGIVLDTGYDMRKHLEEGIYHFDVAYPTEKHEMVAKTTDMSGNVVYSVQRWGW